MGNDLFIDGRFNRSAIMRYAMALATSNRKQFGGLPWDLELKQALTRAWQRAHALKLRALGVKGVLKAQGVF